MDVAIDGIFVLAALFAAWSDARTRRIPNALTISLMAFGVIAHGVTGGWAGALSALTLVAAALAVGSVIHAHGWFGGGDIKMIAAGVGVFSYPSVVLFLLAMALSGGLLAAVLAVSQKRLVGMLSQITHSVIVPGMTIEPLRHSDSVPYGIAIAAGAAIASLPRYATGFHLPL